MFGMLDVRKVRTDLMYPEENEAVTQGMGRFK